MGDIAYDAEMAAECAEDRAWLARHFHGHTRHEEQALTEAEKEVVRDQMRQRYQIAKVAQVGDHCECPTCRRLFTKKTYQQVFCGRKAVGRSSCKDIYHNVTNEQRRMRAAKYRQ